MTHICSMGLCEELTRDSERVIVKAGSSSILYNSNEPVSVPTITLLSFTNTNGWNQPFIQQLRQRRWMVHLLGTSTVSLHTVYSQREVLNEGLHVEYVEHRSTRHPKP